MVIKTYPLGIYEENIYVLVDEKSKDACIVDPGGNGQLLIKNIEELGCNIKYIFEEKRRWVKKLQCGIFGTAVTN